MKVRSYGVPSLAFLLCISINANCQPLSQLEFVNVDTQAPVAVVKIPNSSPPQITISKQSLGTSKKMGIVYRVWPRPAAIKFVTTGRSNAGTVLEKSIPWSRFRDQLVQGKRTILGKQFLPGDYTVSVFACRTKQGGDCSSIVTNFSFKVVDGQVAPHPTSTATSTPSPIVTPTATATVTPTTKPIQQGNNEPVQTIKGVVMPNPFSSNYIPLIEGLGTETLRFWLVGGGYADGNFASVNSAALASIEAYKSHNPNIKIIATFQPATLEGWCGLVWTSSRRVEFVHNSCNGYRYCTGTQPGCQEPDRMVALEGPMRWGLPKSTQEIENYFRSITQHPVMKKLFALEVGNEPNLAVYHLSLEEIVEESEELFPVGSVGYQQLRQAWLAERLPLNRNWPENLPAGRVASFAKLFLEPAVRGIRAGNPSLKIIAPAISFDTNSLITLKNLGVYSLTDYVGFHIYRADAIGMAASMTQACNVANDPSVKKKIIMTEWGQEFSGLVDLVAAARLNASWTAIRDSGCVEMATFYKFLNNAVPGSRAASQARGLVDCLDSGGQRMSYCHGSVSGHVPKSPYYCMFQRWLGGVAPTSVGNCGTSN